MRRHTVNVAEAAKMLGISRNQAYKTVREGGLPCLKFGRRVVIPLSALEMLLGRKLERGEAERGQQGD